MNVVWGNRKLMVTMDGNSLCVERRTDEDNPITVDCTALPPEIDSMIALLATHLYTAYPEGADTGKNASYPLQII